MKTFNSYSDNGHISKRKAMNKRDNILAPIMYNYNKICGSGRSGSYGPVYSGAQL